MTGAGPHFKEVKEVFVQQVLEKLRELARREAELLMRLHRYPRRCRCRR